MKNLLEAIIIEAVDQELRWGWSAPERGIDPFAVGRAVATDVAERMHRSGLELRDKAWPSSEA